MSDPLNIKALVCIRVTSRYSVQAYNSQNHLPVFFSGVHILDDTLWKDRVHSVWIHTWFILLRIISEVSFYPKKSFLEAFMFEGHFRRTNSTFYPNLDSETNGCKISEHTSMKQQEFKPWLLYRFREKTFLHIFNGTDSFCFFTEEQTQKFTSE